VCALCTSTRVTGESPLSDAMPSSAAAALVRVELEFGEEHPPGGGGVMPCRSNGSPRVDANATSDELAEAHPPDVDGRRISTGALWLARAGCG
jgi:hypothetical protein